jgi:hypothetical protein
VCRPKRKKKMKQNPFLPLHASSAGSVFFSLTDFTIFFFDIDFQLYYCTVSEVLFSFNVIRLETYNTS